MLKAKALLHLVLCVFGDYDTIYKVKFFFHLVRCVIELMTYNRKRLFDNAKSVNSSYSKDRLRSLCHFLLKNSLH